MKTVACMQTRKNAVVAAVPEAVGDVGEIERTVKTSMLGSHHWQGRPVGRQHAVLDLPQLLNPAVRVLLLLVLPVYQNESVACTVEKTVGGFDSDGSSVTNLDIVDDLGDTFV